VQLFNRSFNWFPGRFFGRFFGHFSGAWYNLLQPLYQLFSCFQPYIHHASQQTAILALAMFLDLGDT